MTGILTVVLLFPILSTVPSSATFSQISNYQDNSSSISSSFETSSNVTTIENVTQKVGQDDYTKLELESSSNNTLFFENETGTVPNIKYNSANITTISGTTVEGSPGVTGDFNGDGSDDLVIGVPFEDDGDSCITNLAISTVTASGNDGNVPQNVLDNNIGTRWSSLGIGQFITADLGSTQRICSVDIAWYNGNARQYHFVIATSSDGSVFTNRFSGDSSGTTVSSEKYIISPTNARFIRVSINGNTANNWASMTELDIFRASTSQASFDSGAVNVIYGTTEGLKANPLSLGNGRADQIWTQNSPGMEGNVEPGDVFGYSLAAGDFNKDGISDLAIGVPREDVGTVTDAGAVNVIYGSSDGLSATGNQIFTQNYLGFPNNAGAGDWFGYTLATGDFNKDEISDLAIGVPREDVNTHHGFMIDAGRVDIIYGTLTGLNDTNREDWTQYTPSLEFWWDDAEPNDWFGATLTTGDFNKDGISDLTIGVPREDVGSVRDAGQVNVIYYGIPIGAGVFLQTWTQNTQKFGDGVEDNAETNDIFGQALVTGDFNKDGFSDLAIGVPREELVTIPLAGAVNVLYGTQSGLMEIAANQDQGRFDQIWSQNSTAIEDDPEDGDIFGNALAVGDFNRDGISDLAIGVSAEDLGTVELVGVVNVIYGSSQGLSAIRLSVSDGRADQIWSQNSTNVEDNAEGIDLFGFALTAGDFNKDGISDLAIGVPLEDIGAVANAGAVNVIYGSVSTITISGGLNAKISPVDIGRDDQIWSQDSPGIEDDIQPADNLGSSLG